MAPNSTTHHITDVDIHAIVEHCIAHGDELDRLIGIAGRAAMSTRGISRVIAHQMNTIGGPVDFDELQRQFPAATREQIERAVYRCTGKQLRGQLQAKAVKKGKR